jgi:hypothetical protein
MNAAIRCFAAILAIAALITATDNAPAAVDLSTGIRYVIPAGSMDECASKAIAALNKYLQNAAESTTGSHEYVASAPPGPHSGDRTASASATVHCFPYQKGYIVTFTCAAETPYNPYDAASLCLDVAHNFSGKAETALATPTPEPTGCTTANLIGVWVSDDRQTTLTMKEGGELDGSDGVSGSWYLDGTSGFITWNGNHKTTLSPDGKHLSGGGLNLTRKC